MELLSQQQQQLGLLDELLVMAQGGDHNNWMANYLIPSTGAVVNEEEFILPDGWRSFESFVQGGQDFASSPNLANSEIYTFLGEDDEMYNNGNNKQPPPLMMMPSQQEFICNREPIIMMPKDAYYDQMQLQQQQQQQQLGVLMSNNDDHRHCFKVDIDHHQIMAPANDYHQDISLSASNVGSKKGKQVIKKVVERRQPSKNLMAERRRRKRLNERLSMLRSIVPKISKMDRTAILGDTIDYIQELVEKIHKLRGEGSDTEAVGINQINLNGSCSNEPRRSSDIVLKNPPKFDVERRSTDTRIEICCSAKPGLLMSTVNTLEALGLEIQQCVVSCFNDTYSLQASCSEGLDQRTVVSSEDMKQALFRSAGYGGRCL